MQATTITKIERVLSPNGYHYGDLITTLKVDDCGYYSFDSKFEGTGILDTPDELREKADNNMCKRFEYN